MSASRVRENRMHGLKGGSWKRAQCVPRQLPTRPPRVAGVSRLWSTATNPVPGMAVVVPRYSSATSMPLRASTAKTLLRKWVRAGDHGCWKSAHDFDRRSDPPADRREWGWGRR